MVVESISAEQLDQRARLHAALGDPHRLAIVEHLTFSDRAPSELAALLGIDSNLLAHHLGVLDGLRLIERVSSQGDRRRRYVQLVPATIASLVIGGALRVRRVVFVCTENAARSQLAALLWNHGGTGVTATSGGTHPAARVHPGAISAAARRGFELRGLPPRPVPEINPSDLVVTVCDKAHEILSARGMTNHIHWSVSDPLVSGRPAAFDRAIDVLERRIENVSVHVTGAPRRPGLPVASSDTPETRR